MGISGAERDGLIAAVRAVARAEILPRFRRLAPADIAQKSGPDDLVTEADRATERALHAAARQLMPGAAVVGEEAVADNPAVLDRLRGGGRRRPSCRCFSTRSGCSH